MKKRSFILLVGILMCLSIFAWMAPMHAEADATDYLIEEVDLRVEQPTAGYAPRFKAWIQENDPNYYLSDHAKTGFINGVSWKDDTTGQYLTEDDVFVKGHNYTVGVLCNALYGCEFYATKHEMSATYHMDAYINGVEGNIEYGKYLAECKSSIAVYYSFTNCPSAPAPLTQVKVTGVQTPHKLEAPDYHVTVEGSQYRVCPEESNTMQRRFYNGVGWIRDLGGGYTYTMEPLEDTFIEGKIYQVNILIEAVHPYRFAVDSQGQPKVSATVKGVQATVRDAYGYLDPSRYCIVSYQFPAVPLNNYCRLENVEVTQLDAPLPGMQPDYTARVTSGAALRTVNNEYTKNGIRWFDQTASTYINTTDTFQEGHIYRAELCLQAAEGYIFEDDEYGNFQVTASVNGDTAKVANEWQGVSKLRVEYTFPVCQKIAISQMDLSIAAPTLGAKASYKVTFDRQGLKLQARTDGYFENGVAWWDNRENTYLEPGMRFAADRSYNLELYLESEAGYTIANNCTVTVNGVSADVWGSGNRVWVTCAMSELNAVTGWYQVGKDWVFFNTDGSLRTDWMQSGSIWYHFDKAGTMSVGWKEIGGKDYYFKDSGAMATGWVLQGGIWYYLKPVSGEVAIGWQQIGGKTYYFKSSGVMVTGYVTIDGQRYHFDSSGALIKNNKNGWVQENGKWYYYKNDGIVTGWLQDGSTWYYLKPSGEMATGWLKLGSTWYYLKSSGAMATGWLQVGSTWYYLKPSGAMATGWLKLGGTWYYLKPSGAMVTGSLQIGNKLYHFNSSGACLNP